ncbi:MAG: radical SAM-associated putative lipoprotein [Bacteroidales bacterium]|nr:radical SAM-associated putative lipoprotein [Bacteroidales bacterium]MBQ8461710.1 radical SAM-associated putative lipoprotein [Bacteroidales bacterium]
MRNFIHYIMYGLLFLLGYGCSKEKEEDIPCMYGEPRADYKLIGNVKDSDGNPIYGIRVVFVAHKDDQKGILNDTLWTDNNGHFQADKLKYYFVDNAKNAIIQFEDVDGPKNGEFKNKTLQSTDFSVNQTRNRDGVWDMGTFTIKADTTLDKRE